MASKVPFKVAAVLLLFLSVFAAAQTPLYPESAFLSDTQYTNAYYGFVLSIPPQAELSLTNSELAPAGWHFLLALEGTPNDKITRLSIIAVQMRAPDPNFARTTLEQQKQKYEGLNTRMQKTTIGGHQFWRMIAQGYAQNGQNVVEYAGVVGDSLLRLSASTRDEKIFKELDHSIGDMKFFPPSEARGRAGSKAIAYTGPTLPTAIAEELIAHPPRNRISPGHIDGRLYTNDALGFSYQIPENWSTRDDAEPQLLAADQTTKNFQREKDLWNACSRMLLWTLAPKTPDTDYPPTTLLQATDARCVPGVSFPSDPNDEKSVVTFARQFKWSAGFEQFHSVRTSALGDHVFLSFEGTVGFTQPGESLTRRISTSVLVTEHRGYLLTWYTFAANRSALGEAIHSAISFAPAPFANRADQK